MKNKPQKSLGLNAFFNSLQSLLNLIFPLITFPYISRVLSVDGVGKYNFANSIISYFLLLAGLGISTYAVREGAKFRDDRKKFSDFASKIFTLNLFSMLMSYGLLFIILIVAQPLHKYVVAILIFSIQIFFTTIGTDWVYTIFEEYGYITIRNVIFKIISIVLLFVFVRNSNDYLNYIMITVFASSGSYALNFIHARKFCDIKINIRFDWKLYLIPILVIFASNVAIQLYVSSDVTLLGFLAGNHSVGIYSTAVRIYQIATQVLTAMLVVTVPRLSMLMGQKKFTKYKETLKNLVNTLVLIVFPGITGLFMLSKNVVLLIAGEKYVDSTVPLQILCLAIIGSAMSTIFNQCVLLPAKREKKTLISTIISAIVNIALNFALIPLFLENGPAITTLLSEIIMMMMNFYFSRDIVAYIFKDKEFWYNSLVVIVGCLAIILICIICKLFFKVFVVNLILSIMFSILGYAIIVFLLKNTIANSLLSVVCKIKLEK